MTVEQNTLRNFWKIIFDNILRNAAANAYAAITNAVSTNANAIAVRANAIAKANSANTIAANAANANATRHCFRFS